MLKKIFFTSIIFFIIFRVTCYIYITHYCKSLALEPLPKSIHSSCKTNPHKLDKTNVRILIIDGGGIKGIIPLTALQYIEKKSRQPTSQLFDYFAGTSTGAIIVASLNLPDNQGKPRFSAHSILDYYLNLSKSVLKADISRKIFTINGLLGPGYSIKKMHNTLDNSFGANTRFEDLLNKVSISSFNFSTKKLHLFNNWECGNNKSQYTATDIVTSAVATPGYFSPVVLKNFDNTQDNVFVDSVILANDPIIAALKQAFKIYPKAQKFTILHLGTGDDKLGYFNNMQYTKNGWGILREGLPILYLFYKFRDHSINDTIEIIRHFHSQLNLDYHYINVDMFPNNPFDISNKSFQEIRDAAAKLIKNNRKELDSLAEQLQDNN